MIFSRVKKERKGTSQKSRLYGPRLLQAEREIRRREETTVSTSRRARGRNEIVKVGLPPETTDIETYIMLDSVSLGSSFCLYEIRTKRRCKGVIRTDKINMPSERQSDRNDEADGTCKNVNNKT